ncbi:hypothetical protein ATCV1_z681R [Acanthocystis turfacea chlorella virus 1]|uniref:Uncharacterized protein z681R n=1 Tax=Chlorovirus heliozoae TaxID=322019 RepID=A7K9U1_9PHYC|nr:hypothetical protein ATCV1_z681R [Acanthocystis turfacea chlorella virus 1]ABT16815.1 hypothetical protein ATCV1_z681R [Acanthocystis turfacea chlorella virus 1]
MYWLGVMSRWFSIWWKACWATYAMRMLGCFHTEPRVGCASPVRTLMSVVLPAPLGPITPIRDDIATCEFTLLKISGPVW